MSMSETVSHHSSLRESMSRRLQRRIKVQFTLYLSKVAWEGVEVEVVMERGMPEASIFGKVKELEEGGSATSCLAAVNEGGHRDRGRLAWLEIRMSGGHNLSIKVYYQSLPRELDMLNVARGS